MQWEPVNTTLRVRERAFEKTFPDLKGKRSITTVEQHWLKKFVPEVRYFLDGADNIWVTTASSGQPCHASEVGIVGQKLLNDLARWFENTSHDVALITAVLHW